jgi:putative copper resistance protein D
VRAVHFAACLLLLGTFAFDRFVITTVPIFAPWWHRAASRLLLLSLPLALLTGACWFGFVTLDMTGLPLGQALALQPLSTVWNQTRFGHLWQLRLICWLLGTLIAIPFIRDFGPRARSFFSWLGLAPGGLLVGSLAWAGHGQLGTFHLIADVLHLLVSALWPVGLLPLGIVLWQLRSGGFAVQPPRDGTVRLIRRFSLLSIASVLLLTATGLVNAWVLVGSVPNLFGTGYGRVLLVKVLLFAAMVAIGAVNLLYLGPRIAGAPPNPRPLRLLRLDVSAEILLAAAVLLIVGLLGLLEPAVM